MRKLLYIGVLLLSLGPLVAREGGETRDGGYLIKCKDLEDHKSNEWKVYSFDWVMTRNYSKSPIKETTDHKVHLTKIAKALAEYFPILAQDFEQFVKYYPKEDEEIGQPYVWFSGEGPLNDFVGEKNKILNTDKSTKNRHKRLMRKLPSRCTMVSDQELEEDDERGKLNRAITRNDRQKRGTEGRVTIFHYDEHELQEKYFPGKMQLQLSFLLVHEWLHKYIPDYNNLMLINRYLHQSNFIDESIDPVLAREQLLNRGFHAKYLALKREMIYHQVGKGGPLGGLKKGVPFKNITYQEEGLVDAKEITFRNEQKLIIDNQEFTVSQIKLDEQDLATGFVLAQSFTIGAIDFPKNSRFSLDIENHQLLIEAPHGGIQTNMGRFPEGSIFHYKNKGDLQEYVENFSVFLRKNAVIDGFYCLSSNFEGIRGTNFNDAKTLLNSTNKLIFNGEILLSCVLARDFPRGLYTFKKNSRFYRNNEGHLIKADIVEGTWELKEYKDHVLTFAGETKFHGDEVPVSVSPTKGNVNDGLSVLLGPKVYFYEDGYLKQISWEVGKITLAQYPGVSIYITGHTEYHPGHCPKSVVIIHSEKVKEFDLIEGGEISLYETCKVSKIDFGKKANVSIPQFNLDKVGVTGVTEFYDSKYGHPKKIELIEDTKIGANTYAGGSIVEFFESGKVKRGVVLPISVMELKYYDNRLVSISGQLEYDESGAIIKVGKIEDLGEEGIKAQGENLVFDGEQKLVAGKISSWPLKLKFFKGEIFPLTTGDKNLNWAHIKVLKSGDYELEDVAIDRENGVILSADVKKYPPLKYRQLQNKLLSPFGKTTFDGQTGDLKSTHNLIDPDTKKIHGLSLEFLPNGDIKKGKVANVDIALARYNNEVVKVQGVLSENMKEAFYENGLFKEIPEIKAKSWSANSVKFYNDGLFASGNFKGFGHKIALNGEVTYAKLSGDVVFNELGHPVTIQEMTAKMRVPGGQKKVEIKGKNVRLNSRGMVIVGEFDRYFKTLSEYDNVLLELHGKIIMNEGGLLFSASSASQIDRRKDLPFDLSGKNFEFFGDIEKIQKGEIIKWPYTLEGFDDYPVTLGGEIEFFEKDKNIVAYAQTLQSEKVKATIVDFNLDGNFEGGNFELYRLGHTRSFRGSTAINFKGNMTFSSGNIIKSAQFIVDDKEEVVGRDIYYYGQNICQVKLSKQQAMVINEHLNVYGLVKFHMGKPIYAEHVEGIVSIMPYTQSKRQAAKGPASFYNTGEVETIFLKNKVFFFNKVRPHSKSRPYAMPEISLRVTIHPDYKLNLYKSGELFSYIDQARDDTTFPIWNRDQHELFERKFFRHPNKKLFEKERVREVKLYRNGMARSLESRERSREIFLGLELKTHWTPYRKVSYENGCKRHRRCKK